MSRLGRCDSRKLRVLDQAAAQRRNCRQAIEIDRPICESLAKCSARFGRRECGAEWRGEAESPKIPVTF